MVLIANDGVLPLSPGARIYVDGLSAEAAAAYGEVVSRPEDADAAIVFRNAPYEPRTATFIESVFHAGSLEFPADERDRLLELARAVPTILVVHLERPAILTELAEACSCRGRQLRREPRRDPRPRLRPLLARREAPLRAAVVDGLRPTGSCLTCRATPKRPCSRSGTASRTRCAMTPRMLAGSCQCGAVRYEVEDAFVYSMNCHCSRVGGDRLGLQAIAGIEVEKLEVIDGLDDLTIHDSDRRCRGCGSFLYSVVRDDAWVHVGMGSLVDEPVAIRPTHHIWVGSKAPWFEITDDLRSSGARDLA